MPVQVQDGKASGSTIFDVKIVHTNNIHAQPAGPCAFCEKNEQDLADTTVAQ